MLFFVEKKFKIVWNFLKFDSPRNNLPHFQLLRLILKKDYFQLVCQWSYLVAVVVFAKVQTSNLDKFCLKLGRKDPKELQFFCFKTLKLSKTIFQTFN
jgi:hypothetical protein